MSARFQFRRGTSDNIDSVAPVPAAGEPIYNTETNTLRVGDGSAAAGDLAPLANASITGDALLASAANSSSEITLFTHVFSPGDLLVGDLVNMDANGVAVNSSGSARTITLRGELTYGTSTVNLIPEQTVDIANLNFFAGESKLFVVDVRFWSSTTAGRIDGAGRLTWCEDNAATIEYNLLAYISDTLDPDQDWTLTLTSQASATNAILGTNCNAAVRVSRRGF